MVNKENENLNKSTQPPLPQPLDLSKNSAAPMEVLAATHSILTEEQSKTINLNMVPVEANDGSVPSNSS